MKRAILFVTFAALCGAQTTVNGGRDYKGTLKASGSVSAVDFSGAGSTAPAKAGTSALRPTACTQGQIYFATDVAAGQNLYFCTVTGAPGVWTQMSGNAANAMTSGAGAPLGSCAPPALYIDTTNQDLWYCSATNSWKKPTADTSGFATVAGTNTWTGTNSFSGAQLRTSGGSTAVDFTGAGSTAPAKAGASAARPTACTQGQVYFATDAAPGQNLYFCTTTGTPGVWTQMSGTATAITAGAGAPGGNCTPPALYIDTTNQDLWFCGAANSWKRPAADTTGLATLAGANAWTGYSNLSGGQWRPPESTVGNLPSAGANVGKVFMVTDAVTAGSCSSGGGSVRELCRANGSTYECVGGCGSSGGGGSSGTAYVSSLMVGPDLTRTVTGGTHGFVTTALLVAVYDNASPRNAISVGWTVDASTYDVGISFASPQSNYYVVINGGVGPKGDPGPAGATGATGATGASGTGTGTINTGSNPQLAQYVGSGSTLVGAVTVSGDAFITNGGAMTVAKVNGTSVPTNSAADQLLITTASATGSWASVSNCTGAGGVLNYSTSTHTFACHTLAGVDIPANSANTSGTAGGLSGAALTGDVTNSGNTVSLSANKRTRTCTIDNDSQSATALTAAQITGRCEMPFAAHIVEVGVWGGTGTGATQAYSGTTSVQLSRYRPNGASTIALLSAALPTPGSGANKTCAVATTGGTCANGLTSSSSITLAGGTPVAVNAGDLIYVSSVAADGVQTWYAITVIYTAD